MKKRNLFKNNYPDIFDELYHKKNKDIDFHQVYENSGLKVYWQCKQNKKHIWEQTIRARTISGYGCPYCSGRRILPEESFGSQYPEIVTELHPFRKADFDPFKYSSTSAKQVWFKCSEGHEWKEQITYRVKRKYGCKECERSARSLSSRFPEIAEEWHPTKNAPLKPDDITISSKKKIWWKCKKNPSHVWQVSVGTRVFSKSKCPKCTKVVKPYSLPQLTVKYPELAKQWHPKKNGNLTPSEISAGSSKKVWWICPKDQSHEWSATVSNRTKGRGCPFCAKIATDPTNSLSSRFPNIAKQLHPTKNYNLTAENLSYGSGRKVWWQCLDNPSHQWEAAVHNRTQSQNDKCPICSSQYSKANSLQAMHPEIAAQWHPSKNGDLKPDQVTRASGKKVWWQCTENPNHEWNAVIKNRTVLGSGCSLCAKEKNIIRLQEHLFDLVHSDLDYYHEFLSNIRTLKKFCDQDFHKKQQMIQPYNRMIFASVITALETYFSDAFFKIVIDNENLIEKLMLTNPEFNKKQYALSEVIDWRKNIQKKVADYLFNNIIWHNLAKVSNIYRDVLGIDFPDDISQLHKAISIRHDLVHRNGRTKSGAIHKLEKQDLLELISDVKKLVDHVNSELTTFKDSVSISSD